MLNFSQRADESVRPSLTMSVDLWRSTAEIEDGQFMIVISDEDEFASFVTLEDCPPVFVSLRRSVDGMADEIVLGIPDGYPAPAAAQLAAAQIENAIAAVESVPSERRALLVSAYGLKYDGFPGGSARALRPCQGPKGIVKVSIYYGADHDDYLLSRERPALVFVSQEWKVVEAADPEAYAKILFSSVLDIWRGVDLKTRKRLCEEYGISYQKFVGHK